MELKTEYLFPDCMCGENKFERVFLFQEPPQGETHFNISSKGYHREVKRCQACGHYISFHDMDLGKLYSQEYVKSKYCDTKGMKRTLEKIASLPPEESDNAGRVKRVSEFIELYFREKKKPEISVLDIGSGLCVFLNKFKEYGFDCTALDPDPRAADLAQEIAGVKSVCADFFNVGKIGRFDVITFNKVLEHVQDPVCMVSRSRDYLNSKGIAYIEVPDGEKAHELGTEKGEFSIEHYHVFSEASLNLLAERSGFDVLSMGRLIEPSKKHTLWAFIAVAGENEN